MFIQIAPRRGDFVIFWMDERTPAEALVTYVFPIFQKESTIPIRPWLNLCVFRPADGKPWARLEVCCVHDEGGQLQKAHRYSLKGEYDDPDN